MTSPDCKDLIAVLCQQRGRGRRLLSQSVPTPPLPAPPENTCTVWQQHRLGSTGNLGGEAAAGTAPPGELLSVGSRAGSGEGEKRQRLPPRRPCVWQQSACRRRLHQAMPYPPAGLLRAEQEGRVPIPGGEVVLKNTG